MSKYLLVVTVILVVLVGTSMLLAWLLFFKGEPEPVIDRSPAPTTHPVEQSIKDQNTPYEITEAEKWTLQLLQLLSEYQTADFARQREMVPYMERVAQARKAQMLLLAEQNPKEFLRLAIPQELRQQAPEEIRKDVEEWVTKEGVTAVYIIHDAKGPLNVITLVTSEGTFLLLSPKEKRVVLESLVSNTKVEVSGLLLGNKIVVPDSEAYLKILELPGVSTNLTPGFHLPSSDGRFPGFVKEVHAAAQPPTGTWEVAVILVNFIDDTSQPWTLAEMQNRFFTGAASVKAYYDEVSYGQLNVTGSVFGYYTLPISQGSALFTIFEEAIKAADDDIFYPPYASVVVAFDQPGTLSQASVGQAPLFPNDDGPVTTGLVWYTRIPFTHTGDHEIGHNLGLRHAESWECGSKSIEPDPTSSCTRINGGDIFNVMGIPAPGTFPHLNAPHKESLGWISPSQIQEVSADGIYTIDNIETPSAGVKFLKIPKSLPVGPSTHFYFLEYRQPVGFDTGFLDPTINYDGVLVHWDSSSLPEILSHLLDMTPGSKLGDSDFEDPTLQVGTAYTDPDTGVFFEPISKTPSQITVNVGLGAPVCVRANPSVSLVPFTQIGSPGSTLTYTSTVTNNDSAPCGSSTFTLDSNVSSIGPGWNSALVPSSLTLSPGASGNSTVTVTSSGTAPDGFYGFRIRATNSSEPSFNSGLANNGQYVVVSANNPPVVTISNPSSGSSFTAGTNITFTGTATDPEDGNITAALAWTSSIDGAIGAGGSFSTNSLSVGTHTITSSVTDSGGLSGSDLITITSVAPPGPPPPPECFDGLDNDGDGFIDFPDDPECISPTDNDEMRLFLQIPTGPTSGVALVALIENLTNWLFFGFMFLAVIVVILAAGQFVSGGGDPTAVAQARTKILWAAIAITVAVLSKGIVAVVGSILGA